jgi:hypothetical protein
LPADFITPMLQNLSFKNNTKLRSRLPSAWGVSASGNATFPALVSLDLDGGRWQGSLPNTWGGNVSFPMLEGMIIKGPSTYLPADNGLTGNIPVQWLEPGSFPKLRVCFHLEHNSALVTLCHAC